MNKREQQAHPNHRVLLEQNTDWRLVDVVSWLAAEGRRLADFEAFTQGLCEQLRVASFALSRMSILFRTLHPQVLVKGCIWRYEIGASVYTHSHGIEQSDAYPGSPIEYILAHGESFRRRLIDLDAEQDNEVLLEIAAAGGTDYFSIPVLFSNSEIGAMLIITTAEPNGVCGTRPAGIYTLG